MTANRGYSRYFTRIEPVLKIPLVKTYGSAIATILSLIIFIVFAIKPTVETISVLQKQLTDSKITLAKVTEKSENLSLGKSNYQKIDPTIKEQIQIAVPDKIAIKTISQTLESLATQNEASVSALQIQPLTITTRNRSQGKNNQPLQIVELPFTYNVTGAYLNLLKIIEQLKDNTRLISVSSIILNKAGQDQNILMSISGKAYYLK